MAKQPEYTIGRVFVGDRRLEDLTPEEQAAFRRRTVERMGGVLNAYFSLHPDAYVRTVQSLAAKEDAARETADARAVGA